jgi:hypothetical protein
MPLNWNFPAMIGPKTGKQVNRFAATSAVRYVAGLILKRASASRSSGEWNDDDFDVLADGAVVGRIYKANAAPVGTPWMWTLAFGQERVEAPRTAMKRREKPRWQHSLRVGGESERKPRTCRGF